MPRFAIAGRTSRAQSTRAARGLDPFSKDFKFAKNIDGEPKIITASRMVAMNSDRLLTTLKAALPEATFEASPSAPKPVEFTLINGPRVRFYLWTTTPDASKAGRPADEYKAQVIIPGTKPGQTQHFVLDDVPTFLCGYSPIFGIFTFWEIKYHQDCSHSKNLQTKGHLIEAAANSGWEIDSRNLPPNRIEVRAAIHPNNLEGYIRASIEADAEGVTGEHRERFLKLKSPDMLGAYEEIPIEEISLEDVDRKRIAIQGTRLKRHSEFRRMVLTAYSNRCAICEMQLSILDAAHIIPVHHPKGSDEDWNGLALCKNHHALFDTRIMLIDHEMIVRANEDAVSVLRSRQLLGGWDRALEPYVDSVIKNRPAFKENSAAKFVAFKKALRLNSGL